jgi:hypothetical protein
MVRVDAFQGEFRASVPASHLRAVRCGRSEAILAALLVDAPLSDRESREV